ncbi:MAG: VWA domain-containing protein [Acidobacteria bacterium]|nr:VWA domain-containing protein [Acidobacteriota bacterium]
MIAFWFPRERAGVLEEVTVRGRRMERICIYSTTLLSVAGLILLWRRRMRAQFLCLGGWLALFPLIYYAVQYEDRYRSPIMWVTLLLAGLALAALWERLAARPAAASDRTGVSRRNLLLAGGWQDVIFTTGVKVVNVLANVTRKGELVRELTKEDFVLLENGRPQVIRYFSRETDLPLTLGLLVDTSLSQGRVMEAERAASFRFFDQVLRESKDKVFVMQFETGVFLAQKLTSSRKQLDEALSHVDTPSRRELQMQSWSGTRLYDAVVKASREIMAGQKDRKALILLTDGVDVGSDATLAQAIDAALRADTLVYAILFSDTGFFNGGADGRGVLERLARETGGDFFEVTKKKSIDQVYEQIQAELRSQYSLGYVSDVPVEYSEFRKIRLTTRQKGLAVRARDRYWAQR